MKRIIKYFTTMQHTQIKIPLTQTEQKIFTTLVTYRNQLQLQTVLRVAGGWVRDKIMGITSHDIDIALDDMKGQEFVLLLKKHSETRDIKISGFGVTKLNPDQSKHLQTATAKIFNESIDFVNLRNETYNQESRIPTIQNGTPYTDAMRRDFTINSLFYNLMTQQIEDFTKLGLQDIANKIIRTPLQPYETFRDDPLRILRCFRFKGRFDFKIHQSIYDALEKDTIHEALKSKVSRERIGIELAGMLKAKYPILSLIQIKNYHFWNIVFDISPDSNLKDQKLHERIPEISFATFTAGLNSLEKNGFATEKMLISEEEVDLGQQKRKQYTAGELLFMVRLSFLTQVYRNFTWKRGKKSSSLIEFIVKESLKYSAKVANFASRFGEGLLQLQTILQKITNLQDIKSKVLIVKWLRKVQEKWQLIIHGFTALLQIKQSKNYPIDPLELREYILKNKFQEVYLTESYINGTYLIEKGKKGPQISTVLQNCTIWRILNPQATLEQFLQAYEQNQKFFDDKNSYD